MSIKFSKRIACTIASVALAITSIPLYGAVADDTAEPSTTPVYVTGFEDGDPESQFVKRGSTDTSVIAVSTESPATGDKCLEISGRTKSWNGPSLPLANLCKEGTEYVCTLKVKAQWYNTLKLSLQYTDSAGTVHYSNLNQVVSQGEWEEMPETKFSLPANSTDVSIYIEGSDSTTLYIDDFSLKTAPVYAIQEDIPSLSDVYKGYFKIGTAITSDNLSSKSFMDLVKKHFSGSITAGNEMKPENVLDHDACLKMYEESGDDTNPQVSFSTADSIIKYCIENNIPMRAHTLVWHSQTPDWFFKEGYSDSGDWVSKDKMLKRMENYIKNYFATLKADYPDLNIYACDVVNEAWLDDGNPRKASSSTTTQNNESAWVKVFGDNSFIEPAFTYARKYAPAGCKLYYNDFNEYMPSKTKAIVNMATELKEKGLIDGIGMQSHLDVTFPSVSAYEKALKAFCDTGLDVQVTELDATTSTTPSDSDFETQAKYYSDIFDLYVKYSDNISAVVIWGVTDDKSWRSTKYPLLFDEKSQAKPDFYSIVDDVPVKSDETTEVTETKTTTEVPATTKEEPTETEAPTTKTSATTEAPVTTAEPTDTDETTSSANVTLWGDASCDGEVNISDAVITAKKVNKLLELDAEGIANADCYKQDGILDTSDVITIVGLCTGKYFQADMPFMK